jgi:hypothetical protein
MDKDYCVEISGNLLTGVMEEAVDWVKENGAEKVSYMTIEPDDGRPGVWNARIYVLGKQP